MNVNALLGGVVAAGTVAALIGYGVSIREPEAIATALVDGTGASPTRERIATAAPAAATGAAAPVPVAPGTAGPVPEGEDVAVLRPAPSEMPLPDAATPPTADAPAVAGPAPQGTPRPPDAPDAALPRLDMVRVDATGGALVAGAAPAASRVVVRLDGKVVASAEADRTGKFVSLFDIAVSDAPRLLTLETQGADGEVVARAEDSVIVAPTFPPEPTADAPPRAVTEPVRPVDESAVMARVDNMAPEAGSGDDPRPGEPAASPSAAPDNAAPDAPTAPERSDPPTVAAAPSPETDPTRIAPTAPGVVPELVARDRDAPASPGVPRLFRSGPDGLATIPSGTPQEPEVLQDLGIEVIAYDEIGDVQIAGRARTDSRLRVYLDNRPVQTVRVGPDGEWSAPLQDIDSGVYTLRIDEVDANGEVTARVETPFQRTAPEIAAQARRDGAEAITVQTGYTLWALSEGYFGSGTQYVQLFEANRDQIRDPDLIYPGQVFRLPPAE